MIRVKLSQSAHKNVLKSYNSGLCIVQFCGQSPMFLGEHTASTLTVEDGGSTIVQGIRICPQNYTVSQATGSQSHSDWLWAGQPGGRTYSPRRVKDFHFSISSTPALGSTKPPTQWVPDQGGGGGSPRSKAAGDLYIHSPHTSSWSSA
jgi:hypothetical protein